MIFPPPATFPNFPVPPEKGCRLPLPSMLSSRALHQFLLFRLPFAPALLPASSYPSPGPRRLICGSTTTGRHNSSGKKTKQKKKKPKSREDDSPSSSRALLRVKRRTRSDLESSQDSSDFDHSLDRHKRQHVPVMLAEVLQVFSHLQIRSFVDCTVGAGGHSAAMLRSHPELRLLIGFDVDPTALDLARSRFEDACPPTAEVHTRLTNFKNIKSILNERSLLSIGGVDGILLDLGVSSMQLDDPDRGFSILADGPLDMRMNPQASLTAEDVLNSWPEDEIGRILRDYGEESNWRMLQRKIVDARVGSGGLHSTVDLANLIRTMPLFSRGRHGWLKTATRVFQALRIAVNDELKILEGALHDCFDCLCPGGRLAVISFHSLEDRIVKRTFLDILGKSNELDDDYEEVPVPNEDLLLLNEEWIKRRILGWNGIILTKRPITPSEWEEKSNPRCRSAKLRVLQKL